MQYLLCPRCKFRVAANRHMCATCGYSMPLAANPRVSDTRRETSDTDGSGTQKGSFWRTFLGLEPPIDDKSEKSQEEATVS